MADNKKRSGPEDGRYISLKQDYEVRYWCGRLRCSKEELAAAVEKVGHRVTDIATALGLEPPIPVQADHVTTEPPGGEQA